MNSGDSEPLLHWLQAIMHELFEPPFKGLLIAAHPLHHLYFNPNEVRISTLPGIKTGVSPEVCKYCARGKNGLRLPGLNKCKIPALFLSGERDRNVRTATMVRAAFLKLVWFLLHKWLRTVLVSQENFLIVESEYSRG